MKSLHPKFTLFVLVFLVFSCTPAPRFTSENHTHYPSKNNDETQEVYNHVEEDPAILINSDSSKVVDSFTGIASYYAHDFHGRITFNGEVYDMYGLTAAHPEWPMNTIIKATNLSNEKSVVIRVNDRMPKHPERIIDLSLGTAQALGFVVKGIEKVRLDILKWGGGL